MEKTFSRVANEWDGNCEFVHTGRRRDSADHERGGE